MWYQISQLSPNYVTDIRYYTSCSRDLATFTGVSLQIGHVIVSAVGLVLVRTRFLDAFSQV